MISAHRRRYTRETLLAAARAGRLRGAVRQLLQHQPSAGYGGRRLGRRLMHARLARADQPGRRPGLARRLLARGDRGRGARHRRRAARLPAGTSLVCRIRRAAELNDDRAAPWRDNYLVFGGRSSATKSGPRSSPAWTRDGLVPARASLTSRRRSRVSGSPYGGRHQLVHRCAVVVTALAAAAPGRRGDHLVSHVLRFGERDRACRAEAGLRRLRPAHHDARRRRRARRITPRTGALMPVHFAGRPADMAALAALARHRDLPIVEDCAHAIEADHRWPPRRSFGAFGCFSFYVNKNLTTSKAVWSLPTTPSQRRGFAA